MVNIIIGRYEESSPEERATWPKNVGEFADNWQGWIEPEDKSWILFIQKDGTPVLFPKRDKKTGSVLE